MQSFIRDHKNNRNKYIFEYFFEKTLTLIKKKKKLDIIKKVYKMLSYKLCVALLKNNIKANLKGLS